MTLEEYIHMNEKHEKEQIKIWYGEDSTVGKEKLETINTEKKVRAV